MTFRQFRKKWSLAIAVLLASVVCCTTAAAAKKFNAKYPVVGYWQTVDHDTNKPSSVIKIWRAKNGLFYGRINYIYPEDGHKSSDVCRKCKGPLHNKPILGMQIISGFKQTDDPNFYNSGRIMDPTNGKTYKCHMTVKQNGQVLDVHGYIGIPLFGRSDIWYRVHKR